MRKLENMLNGEFTFSVDRLNTIKSDDDTQLNITWIDSMKFSRLEHYQPRRNERSHHPSAFFEYRIKPEFQEFEPLLKKYQIFTHLDNDRHKGCREELKYNCLIYALQSKITDKDLLGRMSNYFVNISHIPTNMLTDFCKTFDIAITLRSFTKDGKIKIHNSANGGRFGDVNASMTFDLATYENHYFVYEDVPVSSFYLKNREDIIKYGDDPKRKWTPEHRWKTMKKTPEGRFKIETKAAHMSSLIFIRKLMEMGAFQQLYRNDVDVDIAGVFHYVHNKKDIETLDYHEAQYAQLIAEKPKKEGKEDKPKYYFYADFETCFLKDKNQEVEFMVCVQDLDGEDKKTFVGKTCGQMLLEYLPDNSVVYFHNLGFDGRLLMKHGVKSNIIKGSRIIQQMNFYKGKRIQMKDSFSMFSQKLANFPKCFPDDFKGLNIQKELFPYRYYTYERVFSSFKPIGTISDCGRDELPPWSEKEKEQFQKNIDSIPECRIDDNHFDMLKYCEFYCQQDVNVLRIGFNAFRKAALKDPINLDIFQCATAPSLAQAYLDREVFYPNGNLYKLSGHVRDFIMKAIYGGRCMTKQNKRWRIETKLDDFDACSLYPSAMARLFTIEGLPKVIPEEWLKDKNYLLTHSFEEDQLTPTKDKFISYYIVEIEITKVGIHRDFPLIVKRDKEGGNRNVNEPCRCVVDMIDLEDKIKYQKIEYELIRGYYWDGNRDHRIRDTIKKLFSLRAEYKKQGNSIQQVIKLIMNSGYGKSIQKPIPDEYKYITKDKIEHYMYEHWHNIIEVRQIDQSKTFMVKMNKIVDSQFNNCVFGVSVLSMSKRIMNEVMCLAEDLGINIYYQDTDSVHIEHDKLPILANEYKRLHGRELIGEDTIGCFHNDFDELKDAFTTIHISLGKKMYYDGLANDKGGKAEHFRMKGIPNSVIVNHANIYFKGNVKDLYEYLYQGNEITFDLNAVQVRFVMEKTGEIKHKNKFERKVRANAPLSS